jgi:pimeloyl-ACP methyl ester carboxylesterase
MNARASILAILLVAAPLAAQDRLGPPPLTTPGADEWYLRTPDTVSLYIREFGRGEPVIVLHGGWGMDHGYMLPALNGLENVAHFVVYDQRGSMRSPAPAEKISVATHVEDLDLLRRRLGLERVTILGHSMGTFLAQAYLEAHPEHVKGLILVGAIPPVSDSATNALREASRVGTRLAERPEVEAELLRQGLLGKTDLTDQEATRQWRIRFAGVNIFHVDRWRQMEGGRVFYSQAAANATSRTMPSQWNFVPVLRAHPCALHVVIGAQDYVDFDTVRWRDAAKQLPNLELHVLPQAGHAAWIDQPDLFRRAVEGAIRESATCAR